MEQTKQNSALICIDFVNEMVSQGGKLTGKGYLTFVEKNNILLNVKSLQDKFRNKNLEIFHVRVSFSENYIEHPANSPLFGKAKEFKALQADTWGTNFAEQIKPLATEKVIVKRRVSAFYGTDLEVILRAKGISTVYLSGVATDLAIESAARDAHDRDFNVIVVSDCCAAANDDDHNKSLITLQKISSVKKLSEIEI
ncbi:MAG: Isochorismatase family protein YecD [Bacteroidia bacterium]|nr:Isochorismatase family protein YecD [Bacteroidia bacterium]